MKQSFALPERALADAINEHKAALAGRPWYVACSGGRDSLSLAYALVVLYRQGVIEHLPVLLHINHGLQSASEAWQKTVEAFASMHGMDCHVCALGLSFANESTARTARYGAFFRLMADDGVLFLAHHGDDQAETVLMRLAKGTALTGLLGMQAWQSRQHAEKTCHLFRPWLSVFREEISRYAVGHALPYIDDPTNDTGDNARAVIRRTLMPALKALNPRANANIARTAFLLQDDHVLLEETYQRALTAVVWRQFLAVQVLEIGQFFELKPSLRRGVLHRFMQGDEIYGADFERISQLFNLCERQDADHRTRIFWQAYQTAYLFCRYGDRLYRYDVQLWQAFLSPWAFHLTKNTLVLVEKTEQMSCVWRFDFPIKSVRAVGRADSVPYRHKTLMGKKLHQTLKVPTWLRDHLWQVDGLCEGERVVYLVSLGLCWRVLGECGDGVLVSIGSQKSVK
ncbi:MAG: tRNA lysidine(34) synthetase TilS [Moraxella sp.]|nr:tRNA lysidine(34) synthetase TilS [Moraxella sp.]